jgi:KDO2-lipid IV(A) lauroyltransferase
MQVLYGISDLAFFIIYYIVKYRREVVFNNLRRSFIEKSDKEIKNIEKSFYRHFCDVMFETIKGFSIRKHEIERRVHIKNLELIEKYYAENRNIVLYAAHQGNWEWLSFLSLFIPYKGISLYKPLSNKYFNDLLRTIRERFGTICIESNKGYRTILKYMRSGQLIMSALIGDQSPPKDGTKHWLIFLNQNTAFLMGAERIVQKTNQIVLFPAFKRKRRGMYELEFKVIGTHDDKTHLIDQYAKVLEQTIVESPEMWLWSHRRWKLSSYVSANVG